MSSDFQSGSDTPAPPALTARAMEMKAPNAFRTISEVATILNVPQHVLRFWESKFQQIRPLKRGGGRRYYRPEDVDLLTNIKDLLYNQGFTIRGVQKLLREGVKSPLAKTSPTEMAHMPSSFNPVTAVATRGLHPTMRRDVEVVLNELKAMREMLRHSGV